MSPEDMTKLPSVSLRARVLSGGYKENREEREEALNILLDREEARAFTTARQHFADVAIPTYRVHSPCGELDAYSYEDAQNIIIWPDSVIIRLSDGYWCNRPLCEDARKRLIEANPEMGLR